MNNLYIGEFCGTCSHYDVCVHYLTSATAKAKLSAEKFADELPEPFKVKLFCGKYKSRS